MTFKDQQKIEFMRAVGSLPEASQRPARNELACQILRLYAAAAAPDEPTEADEPEPSQAADAQGNALRALQGYAMRQVRALADADGDLASTIAETVQLAAVVMGGMAQLLELIQVSNPDVAGVRYLLSDDALACGDAAQKWRDGNG